MLIQDLFNAVLAIFNAGLTYVGYVGSTFISQIFGAIFG